MRGVAVVALLSGSAAQLFQTTPTPTSAPSATPYPSAFSASPTSNCVWALQFGIGPAEYEVSVPLLGAAPGVYRLTAFAKYSNDYVGGKVVTHSRWFDVDGVSLGTTSDTPNPAAWPTEHSEYHFIEDTFDTQGATPNSVTWFVGFAPGSVQTEGSKWVTHLQIVGPNQEKYIADGDLAGGEDLLFYIPGQSFGDYEIVRDCSATVLTYNPTVAPPAEPSTAPSTLTPTPLPTPLPSPFPSPVPTNKPTWQPTVFDLSPVPTNKPTWQPTVLDVFTQATWQPTLNPTTLAPSKSPTDWPTQPPTKWPTTLTPSKTPTKYPTKYPTSWPTEWPTTHKPTNWPSKSPTTEQPTKWPTTHKPTNWPSKSPTTEQPSNWPVASPQSSPSPTT